MIRMLLVVAAGSALLGCGGRKLPEPAIPPPSPEASRGVIEPGSREIAVHSGAFRLTFALESAVVNAGEPLVADVALSNRYGRPARIVFPTTARFDLIVSTDPEGDSPITGWSWGQETQPMAADLQLTASQVIARRMEFATGPVEASPPERTPFIPPGKYFVRAMTMSDPFIRTPTVGVEVRDPLGEHPVDQACVSGVE